MASLQELRSAVLNRADMTNTNFISSSELNYYINRSAEELYELLVVKYEDYYIETLTFSLSNTDGYQVPSGVFKLRGVDVLSGSNYIPVERFNFSERTNSWSELHPYESSVKYRLIGSTVKFIPSDNCSGDYKVWFIPRFSELSSDSDELTDDLNQWQDYIVVDAAIKCLQKEESDVSVLAATKMALINRINNAASNRDAGTPETVSAVRNRETDLDWIFRR